MFYNEESINSLKKIIGEYHFRLNRISDIKIKIRLFKYLGINDENIHFETSHFIHVPNKAGAYTTSRTSESTEEIALERAISTITEPYENAIRDGYSPSDSWLVKNDVFD